jgi:hypothetical protein
VSKSGKNDRAWNRCDACGRFIAVEDFQRGALRLLVIDPPAIPEMARRSISRRRVAVTASVAFSSVKRQKAFARRYVFRWGYGSAHTTLNVSPFLDLVRCRCVFRPIAGHGVFEDGGEVLALAGIEPRPHDVDHLGEGVTASASLLQQVYDVIEGQRR